MKPVTAAASGPLLLLSLTLFWGVNWPAIKLSVNEVPAWTFRSICLLTGATGLLLIARLVGSAWRIPRRDIKPLLISAFGNVTCWHILSALGVQLMLPGRAAILAFTMPLWVAPIAALWLKERLRWNHVAGLGMGLAGIAVLVAPDWRGIQAAPLGPLIMIAAAVSWAFGTVSLKAHKFSMPTTALAGWQLLLGGIPIFLGALIFNRNFDPAGVSLLGWSAVAYAALIPMIYCHWAWFRVVGLYPAMVAGIGTLAIPVVGVLSSAVITGEPIGWSEFLALGLVLVALFLTLILPHLSAMKAARPAIE
jgi:drug/metabolite transporter (DMT)-like permease